MLSSYLPTVLQPRMVQAKTQLEWREAIRMIPLSSREPEDLERSEPSTPHQDGAAGIMPSFRSPAMNKWRVFSACGQYFVNGMNDSAPGPLIPYIEQWYGIGYAVVSTIWLANAVGFHPCRLRLGPHACKTGSSQKPHAFRDIVYPGIRCHRLSCPHSRWLPSLMRSLASARL